MSFYKKKETPWSREIFMYEEGEDFYLGTAAESVEREVLLLGPRYTRIPIYTIVYNKGESHLVS